MKEARREEEAIFVEQIAALLKQVKAGISAVDVCRQVGIRRGTTYSRSQLQQ
jgi:hypothetical protein